MWLDRKPVIGRLHEVRDSNSLDLARHSGAIEAERELAIGRRRVQLLRVGKIRLVSRTAQIRRLRHSAVAGPCGSA